MATIRIQWWGPSGPPTGSETRLRVKQKTAIQDGKLRSRDCRPGCKAEPLSVTVAENVHYETALLERIARQESDALGELYDRVSPVLFGMACRMLNSETEAEDLVQEVFLKVWEKAVSFDSRLGTPIAWLITLTRNRAHDRLRSVSRRSRILEVLKLDGESRHEKESISPEQSVMALETVTAMQEALKQLPPEQRQAIELAFLGGLSQSEIAAQLNEPLGTIKARIRRGMSNLRRHLPQEWQETDTDLETETNENRDRLNEAN